MNIITQKDVFSEENQAKLPKKVERRRGRPRKDSTPQTSVAAEPELGTPVTPDQLAPVRPLTISASQAADAANKTVFYQASRPKAGEAPTENLPTPIRNSRPTKDATTDQTINPAQLAAELARKSRENHIQNRRPAQQANQPQQPPTQNATPDNRREAMLYGKPTGFTAAPRRSDRHHIQDGAGVFMQTAASQQSAISQPGQVRNASELKVKIIPLGGLEEIGKNMTVFEYGNDIIIIDMGFMFPEGEMFGVDYIIPDVTYLEDKKDRIRGAIITHGHLDHTGAIPYLVEKLGFPTMYGTAITMGMAKQRLEEFNLVGRNKMVVIEPEKDVIQLGAFKIRPFHLIHSIPGAIGLEIETPNGRIAYCTDWKFDYTPANGQSVDFRTLAAIGSRGVDLLFSDSTNALVPGHSISEKVVEQSLTTAIEAATGRVIIAMFSSNLNRIQQTMNVASRQGRKVLVLGRSMQQNVEMAIGLKAIIPPANTIISEREASRFNDEQLLVLSTGAQGEDRSALQRMATGEHKVIKIKKGDTVIISASPIPGNERSVGAVMDILYKAGAQVVYNKILDIHTTGHATQEDLKLMLALMRPKYFVPLHGERSKLIAHGKLAEEVGVSPESVIIGDNGLILAMDNTGKVAPTDDHVPAGYVMVDGLGVGDVGNIVLRDRQAMAQEGIFVVISVYDQRQHKFLTSPDLISRGFIYMRENEQFINEVRTEIKKFLTRAIEVKNPDINQIKNDLRDMVSKMLYDKTERQPMVIPVIIEV